MNKGRRQELRKLKYKKRLKRLDFEHLGTSLDEVLKNPRGKNYNFTCLKDQSTPCSCHICTGDRKYKRFKFKKETNQILKDSKFESNGD